MSTTEKDTLEQQEAELLAIINKPTEKELAARKLIEVQTAKAEKRKQEEFDAAKARMIGIKRAYGSLRDTYAEDGERVSAAVRELNEATEKMNARYAQLVTLEDEARGLNKTYDVPQPEFTNLKSPDRVQPPSETVGTVEVTRLLDHRDIVRIARAAAAGLAQQEAAAMSTRTVEPQAPTRPRPKMSESEQRAAGAMAEETRDTNRALRSIPGRV